jgi:hypothetical protein
VRRLFLGAAVIAALALAGLPSLRSAGASQLIVNGDFESGTAPWQSLSRSGHTLIGSAHPHSGSFGAQLCGTNSCYDQISQAFVLPPTFTHAVLTYWIYVATQETSACIDIMRVRISAVGLAVGASAPSICNDVANGVWLEKSADLGLQLRTLAGKQVQLSFLAITNTSRPTTFYVDDVQFNTSTAVAPTATPTPTPGSGGAGPGVISSDPFSSPVPGQHHSEVEPDTFAYGDTLVAAFQAGRIYNGGSTDLGWARFRSGAWTSGMLPGLTVNGPSGGTYARASDPSVAYDAAHGVWLIASLDLDAGATGVAVSVNRSTDGAAWGGAVTVAGARSGQNFDKEWIVCDDTGTSPYYGHCYVEWDDNAAGDTVLMSTSTDGGQTWSPPREPAGAPHGLGGQPQVQPNGTVVVPLVNATESTLIAFRSSDGGATWGPVVSITGISDHSVAGALRTEPLPTAEIDGSGTVFVAWQDCRFEPGCSANDIVYSESADGVNWSRVQRVPIDPIASGIDHFIPGLAVSTAASGAGGRLALTYYYYPTAACGPCSMDVGYVTSTNGGQSWSAPVRLGGPMQTSWLPSTSQGLMVGDYISTSFLGAQAMTVFPAASPPAGAVLSQPMYGVTESVSGGLRLARNRETIYAARSASPSVAQSSR